MRPPTERPPVDLRLVPAACRRLGGDAARLGRRAGRGRAGRVRRRRARLPTGVGRRSCSPPQARRPRPGSSSRPTPSWWPRVHDQALRGAAATLRVVLRDDPRILRTSGQPGPAAARVVVPAELVATTAGAGSWQPAAGCCCSRPPRAGSGLLPGQSVTAEGLLAPAERSDLTVAVLRVRGAPRDVALRPGGSPPPVGCAGPAGRHGHAPARRGRAAARPGHRRHQRPHPGGRRRLPRRRASPICSRCPGRIWRS